MVVKPPSPASNSASLCIPPVRLPRRSVLGKPLLLVLYVCVESPGGCTSVCTGRVRGDGETKAEEGGQRNVQKYEM